MAAAPKLSPTEWAVARNAWESDPRVGFAWLPAQLSLPVSRESVRKKSEKEGWKKRPELFASRANSGSSAMVAMAGSGNLSATLKQINANEAKPFKTRETPILDQLDEDEPRQGLFVREYVKDLNGAQSAIRAGYSVDCAKEQASRLLSNANVQSAIRELRDETLRNLEANVEELVRYWLDVLRADPNEITSYRRPACPYCHGELKDDGYKRHRQYTPAKFSEAKTAHEIKRARTLESDGIDIGDFDSVEGDWYKRRAPNPACPECLGEGVGEMFIKDTRNLPPGVAALFNGVEKTKEGIKILMGNKEKAADQLGRFLGAFKDRDINVSVTMPTIDALRESFERNREKARERQLAVYRERGIPCDENGNPLD